MTTKLPFNLQRFGAAIGVAVALGFATRVHAFTLTAANAIGSVLEVAPANSTSETLRLQFFIDFTYPPEGSAIQPPGDFGNFIPEPLGPGLPSPLPGPASFGATITKPLTQPITVTTSYTYLMANFGDDSVYYYLGGQTGSLDSLSVPSGFGIDPGKFAYVSLFNPITSVPSVPDGGATIILLGGMVLSLAFLRRRFAA